MLCSVDVGGALRPGRTPHVEAPPELARAALRHLGEAIVCVDAAGVVVSMNDAARALFGRADIGCHISECAEYYGVQRPDGTPVPPEEIPLARAFLRHFTGQSWSSRPDPVASSSK